MFGRPWVLLLLALPVGLMFFVWAYRARRTALPFDHARAGAGRTLRAALACGESLPALLMAVAVMLLAEPQKLDAPRVKRALTNIQFCVDISGSMTAKFGAEGTRYDGAMNALNKFLDYREGDAFGLTFFGNSVLHWVPLTSDASAFRCAPPFMRPENAPPGFGGTEIGKAVLACREVLTSREDGDRMIILITDGFSSDLMGGADEDIARKLKRDNIVLYAVNIQEGTAPGEVVNLARITGGEVFNVVDPGTLETVFKRIDEMQKAKLEKGSAEYVDNFWPFCLAGLILLGLYTLMQLGLRHTPW